MRKRIIDVGGGKKSIEFEEVLLDIIGASGATEVELRTDGRSLILSPVGSDTGHGAPAPAARGAAPTAQLDCADPRETIRVIRLLEPLGLDLEVFRQLHHFGRKASLQAHLTHCQGTHRFSATSNITVCERLRRCLELRQAGVAWDDAIATARREFPFHE